MVKGWKDKSKFTVVDIISLYKESDVGGYVITDIKNDGMLKGLDTIFIKSIIDEINKSNETNKKAIIAGGLTNYDDLKKLKQLNLSNIEGIISGKSFYVGNIDLKKAQQILNNNE